jgi:hypothetical protein
MPSNPWKRADNEPSQVASSSQGFPPLVKAQVISKAQRRTRALYTQSPTFEPYPPRIDNLNRQELDRRQLLEGIVAGHRKIGGQEADADQPQVVQQNGMSSITIYNADGERLSNGPDIYRRFKPMKASQTDGKERIATIQSRYREIDAVNTPQLPLPSPFTDKRLDTLMQEGARLERVRAIEDRAKIVKDNGIRQDLDSDPLEQELLKAFSSLNGFTAAFGKDQIKNSI